jgi:signal transduction histidine kinase
VGYWLSGRALAPVNQIVRDARAIDSNRLSQRVSVPEANDELRQLSETVNSMLERIEVSMTRIKQFTADASHELRAPLTLIQAAAEYTLRRERSRDELVEAMEKILRESKRTSQLIDNLLLLARADSDDQVLKHSPVLVNSALPEGVERRPAAHHLAGALHAIELLWAMMPKMVLEAGCPLTIAPPFVSSMRTRLRNGMG